MNLFKIEPKQRHMSFQWGFPELTGISGIDSNLQFIHLYLKFKVLIAIA